MDQSTQILAILNLTPDSFSDGLAGAGVADFLAKAEQLIAAGADILDIGGESTRPGAALISLDEEKKRVLSFLEAFRQRYPDFPLSLDTRKATMARAVAPFGIAIINDTSCLADPELALAAHEMGARYVLMHSRGVPETMRSLTTYPGDVVQVIFQELSDKLAVLREQGFSFENLILDPGFGFAKSPEQCRLLMERIGEWRGFAASLNPACPPGLLFAISRKRFLELYIGPSEPGARDAVSAELALKAVKAGFHLIRTHNVALTRQYISG